MYISVCQLIYCQQQGDNLEGLVCHCKFTLVWLNLETDEREPTAHFGKLIKCFSYGHLHFKQNFSPLFTYSNTIFLGLLLDTFVPGQLGSGPYPEQQ